jgi:hypothetical protein
MTGEARDDSERGFVRGLTAEQHFKGRHIANPPVPKTTGERNGVALKIENKIRCRSARPRMRPQNYRKQQGPGRMRSVQFSVDDFLANRAPPQLRAEIDC